MVNVIFDKGSLLLDVTSPLPNIYLGPTLVIWYTILQGAFTVLAIKEVWSIFGVLVKGKSNELCIDRVILWHLTENWEDLLKTFRYIYLPCVKDLWYRAVGKKSERISSRGWRRVAKSGILALLLFLIDFSLVVLSAPSLDDVHAVNVQSLIWSNKGKIRTLERSSDVLQGSFSRTIILNSKFNDVEFVRQPSLSLERTYFDDFALSFDAKLPPYAAKFFECDATEKWRIICRVYCNNKLYQYKMRIDISMSNIKGEEPVEGDSFFVTTENFSVAPNATNPLKNYVNALRKQLGINDTVGFYKGERFELRAANQPPERTVLRSSGYSVLTHDAIATIFLSTIDISADKKGAKVFRRKEGERMVAYSKLFGKIAVSQRPYVPLLGIFAMYLCLAIISGCMQWTCRATNMSKELKAIMELMALPLDQHLLNTDAEPLRVERSRAISSRREFAESGLVKIGREDVAGECVEVEHIGYLPAGIVLEIAKYVREVNNCRIFQARWGIIPYR